MNYNCKNFSCFINKTPYRELNPIRLNKNTTYLGPMRKHSLHSVLTISEKSLIVLRVLKQNMDITSIIETNEFHL